MVNKTHPEPELIINETRQAEDRTSAYEFKTSYQSNAEQFNAEVVRNSRHIRNDNSIKNEKKNKEPIKKSDSPSGLQTLKLLLIGYV